MRWRDLRVDEWLPAALVIAGVCACAWVLCWAIWQATLPAEGLVVSKHYRAAYTSLQTTPIGNGSSVTVPVQHPERWTVILENGKHLSVDETTYHEVRIGDRWGEGW